MKSVFNGVGVFLLQKSSSDESSLMTMTKTKTHEKTYKKMYEKHTKRHTTSTQEKQYNINHPATHALSSQIENLRSWLDLSLIQIYETTRLQSIC